METGGGESQIIPLSDKVAASARMTIRNTHPFRI